MQFSGNLDLVIDSESLLDGDEAVIRRNGGELRTKADKFVNPYEIALNGSVLAVYKTPTDPVPSRLAGQLEKIRIYREFRTGMHAGSRYGISTHLQSNFLTDAGDNLALVLQDLLDFRGARQEIQKYLRGFAKNLDDVRIKLSQGVAQVWLHEAGLASPLPSARMSDGTLKFLCLLAVLLEPEPPPLVCIEEPEQDFILTRSPSLQRRCVKLRSGCS